MLVGKKSDERYEPLPIRVLFLGNNNITSLHPSLFQHMEFLRELHLDYNPLTVDQDFTLSLSELPELKVSVNLFKCCCDSTAQFKCILVHTDYEFVVIRRSP